MLAYMLILLDFINFVSAGVEILVSGDIQNVEPYYIKMRE